jgi:hypothetical protein
MQMLNAQVELKTHVPRLCDWRIEQSAGIPALIFTKPAILNFTLRLLSNEQGQHHWCFAPK